MALVAILAGYHHINSALNGHKGHPYITLVQPADSFHMGRKKITHCDKVRFLES
jgi:hypothetical protein